MHGLGAGLRKSCGDTLCELDLSLLDRLLFMNRCPTAIFASAYTMQRKASGADLVIRLAAPQLT